LCTNVDYRHEVIDRGVELISKIQDEEIIKKYYDARKQLAEILFDIEDIGSDMSIDPNKKELDEAKDKFEDVIGSVRRYLNDKSRNGQRQ
jgi:hypothetical protein